MPTDYEQWREQHADKKLKVVYLATKQGSRCAICNIAMTKPKSGNHRLLSTDRTVDHIIPVSQGGTDAVENMQLLCNKCNQEKNSFVPPEHRKKVEKKTNKIVEVHNKISSISFTFTVKIDRK